MINTRQIYEQNSSSAVYEGIDMEAVINTRPYRHGGKEK